MNESIATSPKKVTLDKILSAFGSQKNLAMRLDLTPQAVSVWVKKKSVPSVRAKEVYDLCIKNGIDINLEDIL